MGLLVAVVMGMMLAGPALATPVLERIELVGNPATAVRVHLSAPAVPRAQTLGAQGEAPDRVYLDLASTTLGASVAKLTAGAGPLLLRVRVAQFDVETARVVLDLTRSVPFDVRQDGATITIELLAARVSPVARNDPPTTPPAEPPRFVGPPAPPAPSPPSREPITVATAPPIPAPEVTAATGSALLCPAPPVSPLASLAPRSYSPPPPPPAAAGTAPARSASQAAPRRVPRKGLFPLVVLDAGHGGRDPGAEGVGGVLEKDVVLEVAQLVARRLAARLPVDVLMTRTDDSFIPIEHRLASENATLFISLHANACTDPSARGLEIFYGGGSLRAASTHPGDWRAALLGRCLDQALETRIGGVRGTARPAGFGVLVRNPVPSALVEIGYLTHPDEAARTQDRRYHELLADALVDGVAAFLRASAPPL